MTDLSTYRQKAIDLGKMAVAAEEAKDYEQAYNHYYSALKIFMHMIKCKLFINYLLFRRKNG